MKQKINWMRFLLIGGISLFLGLLSTSCEKTKTIVEHRTYNDYYYVNNTGYLIRVKTFNKEDGKYYLIKEYAVPNSDTLKVERHISGSRLTKVTANPFYMDSVTVSIGNNKCEYFVLPETGGVTAISNYKEIDIEEHTEEFLYVFTEEHYQNAQTCK